MKTVLLSIFVVSSLFAVCLALCYAVSSFHSHEKKDAPPNDDAKIFYITNIQKKSKPKPKRKPSSDISISGKVLTPKEFQTFFSDEEKEN